MRSIDASVDKQRQGGRRWPGQPMARRVIIALVVAALWPAPPALWAKVVSGGATLETQWVEWTLLPEGCSPPQGGTVVACGDYGSFLFDAAGGAACAVASGNEQPPAYVKPGLGAYPAQPALRGGPRPGRLASRSLASLPCAEGSCFEPPGGATGSEPWLAIIDWDSEHGWTTGWSAISLSGSPAHLYPLDGPDLAAFLGPAVGDAHLLARLCQVAEAIDHQQQPAPRVLNMSFGRLFEPGHDTIDGGQCDASNLSCHIARLFEHLYSRGVVATAAAGNYAQVQLPAGYDAVLAVGNLDLAELAANKLTAPAWETPSSAQTLMPGYGVCLEPDQPVNGNLWPAPPGSSYASALFAGWLADTLAAYPVADPLAVEWRLAWSSSAECFVISNLQPVVCNAVADHLLDRILGSQPTTCWQSDFDTWLEVDLVVETAQQGLTQQLPSLVEWVELGHVPTPESDPCVPCVDDGFNQSFTGSPRSLGERLGGGGASLAPLGSGDLMLDLSASSPLRPFLVLEALHLRIGDDYFPLLERARPQDVAALDALEDAEVAALVVRGARRLIAPDQQPSLVFVMCEGAGACFWTSVPVLNQP